MNLGKAPKQFCEQVMGGFSQEFFVMALFSGATAQTYALTPQHAKRLSQWLSHTIKDYEKRHGEIDAEWSPGPKSPIQSVDLSDGDDKKGIDGKK